MGNMEWEIQPIKPAALISALAFFLQRSMRKPPRSPISAEAEEFNGISGTTFNR
jgi:hypothetical protein